MSATRSRPKAPSRQGVTTKELLETLEKFENGELPQFSALDVKKADAALQSKFSETQTKSLPHESTATAAGIRKTQRLWLQYREAWIALGKARYPNVRVASWKSWAAQERVVMLERSLH